MEINLLPWREKNLQQQKINYSILIVTAITFIVSAFWLGHQYSFLNVPATYFPVETKIVKHINKKNHTPKYLKYVGYIRQQNIIWGIISLAQEAAQDVQVGKLIPEEDLRVISIDENKMVLLDNEKKRYVIKKSVLQ